MLCLRRCHFCHLIALSTKYDILVCWLDLARVRGSKLREVCLNPCLPVPSMLQYKKRTLNNISAANVRRGSSGCLLAVRGCSWGCFCASPGCSWVLLNAPGCLLDAPWCCWELLGAHVCSGCFWGAYWERINPFETTLNPGLPQT